jgi:hypothetical protein
VVRLHESEWVEIFSEGWMSITDYAYPGHLSTATCFVVKEQIDQHICPS